jgi:Signal transduction histidine kinase involved in nitrogen fixation and metabolism regulation
LVKLLNSLITKLTVSFIILILIVSCLTFFYTYSETKDALKDRMQNELKAVASVAATQINGTSVAALQTGDEGSAAFLAINQQLNAMRDSNPDILYIYLMRQNGDNVEFVVDADYGMNENGASIGQVYEDPNDELLAGFAEPNVDEEFTTDEWGTVLSGYAPVKDTNGNVVGLLGVDMDSAKVMAQQEFIGNTIYLIIGIGILIAALMIGYFVMNIIRDINKLNRSAEKISKGDLDVVVDVRRKDEVGELADSFSRMVASIKFERMSFQEDLEAAKAAAPEIKK